MVTLPTSGSLGFRVTEGEISVDPATAEARVALAALEAGIALSLTVYDVAGVATARWRLGLALEDETEAGTAPAAVRAPALAGTGLLGAEVTLDPGEWSGSPAPSLGFRWLRDGAEIDGATAATYRPAAADDATAISCRVTASNASGSARAETPALAIRRTAPVASGRIGDQALVHGAAAGQVAVAPAFTGEALVFSVAGGGATVDPASGAVTLPTGTLRAAETVTVTATNSGGATSVAFRVTVAKAAAGPVAVGTLPGVVWPLAEGSRTVSAQAGFAGEGLAYALEAAPAGATIAADSGLVTIPTGTALAATKVTVRASNVAGSATQSFTVSVQGVVTVFATAATLAEMSFVTDDTPPAWTLDPAGFARLAVASEGTTHGLWTRSAGDGRYRALVRWTAGTAVDRPVCLTTRLARSNGNYAGLRFDALISNGTSMVELRQYSGSGSTSIQLGLAPVALASETWTWIEVALDGATVRARLYPETAAAPDWQIVATTTRLEAGAAGIGGYGRWGQRPQIDIRRIELLPLGADTPLAAAAGEWTLTQNAERQA